jgi:CMP-N,N'-diacetyllegionaminic acid synthase
MIVVVPARGGSRRLPRKNIQLLAGRPLLAYTLGAVFEARLNLPVYVSTDDDAIAAVARTFATVKVIDRPKVLASDTASTEMVLLHVLDSVSESVGPEWVMTLPPTSPFRTPGTIRRFVDRVVNGAAIPDCLMSVTENRGDFWLRNDDETMRRLFPDAPRRQQERTPLYEENSAIYLTRVSALRETGSILGKSVHGISISPIEGFDINTPDDLRIADCIAMRMQFSK